MANSFKELGRKAEALIEQGREADRKVQSFQAGVAAAARQVAAAKAELARAAVTDAHGLPKGDVHMARVRLDIAQNQLEASRRALSGAQSEAARIRREKAAHAEEIERHNRISRENLAKLEKLSSAPFAADSASLARGIAERFNAAEQTRVALLRSMGIEAVPDHISLAAVPGGDPLWRAGGFGPLDLSGGDAPTPGGEGTFAVPGLIGTEPAPAGAGDGVSAPREGARPDTPESAIRAICLDGDRPAAERIAELKALRERAIAAGVLTYSRAEAEGIAETVKAKRLPARDYYSMGMRYIEDILEVYRDNLRDRGVSDGEAMEAALAPVRAELLERLGRDLGEGTYFLCDHEHPDYDALAAKVRDLYATYPPKYKITDVERTRIRADIRSGTVTEKEIRDIGRNLRKHRDALLVERNAEWDRISRAHISLARSAKAARTPEERERLELQRRLLVERENAYHQKYNHTAIMKAVLASYRPIGPAPDFHPQPYQRGIMPGSSKVIQALEKVREAVPTDWIRTGNDRPIAVRHVSRGFFFPEADRDIIALSGADRRMERCAFHEMGHRFERLYPEILTLEKQFYERRTAGEPLVHLGPGYGPKEVSRFDRFLDPYMGKDYGGSGYELLSMGMESAFCGSYDLSRDTEFSDLIFGILATV